jgi:hypothetical protein
MLQIVFNYYDHSLSLSALSCGFMIDFFSRVTAAVNAIKTAFKQAASQDSSLTYDLRQIPINANQKKNDFSCFSLLAAVLRRILQSLWVLVFFYHEQRNIFEKTLKTLELQMTGIF